jgi:DNA-binding transcriptional LysR family regulator
VSLLDQMRQAGIKPKRVHTISSISAMAQLVQGGFGVATLPLAAIQNPTSFPNLKPLKCDTALRALPIYASYREDPTSNAVQSVVASAQKFVSQNLK